MVKDLGLSTRIMKGIIRPLRLAFIKLKTYKMNITFRFILLLLHCYVTAVLVYLFGDIISKQINIFFVILLLLLYICNLVTIVLHIKNFIINIKNKNL